MEKESRSHDVHTVLMLIIGAACLGIAMGSLTGEGKTSTRPEQSEMGAYRPDIDGLRAVAVIAVIIYHLQHSWLPGGFLGVDIFFVISGYVVTGAILKHPSSSFSDCMAGFYVRRIKRIAPNLMLVVIVTGTLIAILIWPLADYGSTLQTGGSALFGCSNIFFATQGANYFDEPAKDQQNQFLHTWSLGVEEQFYMIYPIVLLVAYGLYQHTGSKPSLGGRRSVATWSICIVASFVAQRSSFDTNAAFYLLPFRFWQMGMGAFLVDTQEIWSAWVQHRLAAILLQLMAAVLIILSFGGLVTTEPWASDMPGLWMSVLGAVCYIMAGATPHSSLNGWLSKDMPVYIGRVSYSLYLWHWPVLTLSPWALPISRERPFACLSVSVLVFIIVAVAVYATVERVCRKIQNPRPSLAFGMFFFAACLCLSWLLALSGPLYGKLFNPVVIADSSIPKSMLARSRGPPQCFCSGVERDGEDDEVAGLPACMWAPNGQNIMSKQAPEIDMRCDLLGRHVFDPWDTFGTEAGRDDELLPLVVDECLVDPIDAKSRKLYLFGDSHAHALVPGIKVAAAANRFDLRVLTASSHMLTDYLDVVLPVLEKHIHAGDVVMIAHASGNTVNKGQLAAVMALHNVTSARKASVLIVGDLLCEKSNNEFHKGPLCMMDPGSCTVPRQSMNASKKKKELAAFKGLKHAYGDIHIVDIGDTFCDGTTCAPFIPSTNILGIGSTCHFSFAGSYSMWPQLCTALSTLN